MKSIVFFALAIFSLSMFGCDKCGSYPPSDNLVFYILSANNSNLVGRAPTQYSPDSIRIRFQGQPMEFEFLQESIGGNGGVIDLNPKGFDGKSDARLLVRLTHADTDTIDITYKVEEDKCATLVRYNSVFYNGRRMGQDGNGVYLLIKK